MSVNTNTNVAQKTPTLNVINTPQPIPTLTGNTTNLGSVFKDFVGDTWIVDLQGNAIKANDSIQIFAQVVYVNAVSPTTATIFDLNNPPVTNDNALKNLDTAIYIGTDGSIWTSNGTVYSTYTAPVSLTGSGANTRVPFFNSATNLTSDADFTFDATNKLLSVGDNDNANDTTLNVNGAIRGNANGGALLLTDGASNQIFRGLLAQFGAGLPNFTYFQLGSANSVFTGVNGTSLTRFGTLANSFQISANNDNVTNPVPTGIFEVRNGANALMNVLATGNTGINTTAPTEKLHVIGNTLNEDGFITARNLTTTNQFRIDPMDGVGPKLKLGTTADPVAFWEMGAYNSINNFDNKGRDFKIFNTGNANALMVKATTGNVGISTNTPLTTLQVNNTTPATNTINANAQVLRLSRPQTTSIKWDNIAQFNLGSYSNASASAFSRLDLAMTDGANNTILTNVATFQANAMVGINNTAPLSNLDINGSFSKSPTVITGSYTALTTDNTIIANNNSTTIIITLPNPTTCIGREISISRAPGSTGTITITNSGTPSIQNDTAALGVAYTLPTATGNKTWQIKFKAVTIGATTSWLQSI